MIEDALAPTALRFSPDGRIFVAEKGGRILTYDSLADPEPTVFANLRPQVLNHHDRGLISIALAPNFPDDPWVYLLYTADMSVDEAFNDANEYPPKWGVVDPWSDYDGWCPVFREGCIAAGRLSRIRDMNGVGGPEEVLVQDWFQQFRSHSVGDLVFAPDGMLYVSAGDGASFHTTDLGNESTTGNPDGDPLPDDPPGEGGSLRGQDLETDTDTTGLSGAILRLDPSTGAGAPGNPLAASSDPNARRIIAYGLRNPFRLALRPNGELWIGDVGWNTREEIDRLVSPGSQLVNFGWPCWEGNVKASGISQAFATTPICERMYDPDSAHGLPSQPHVPHTPPVIDYGSSSDQPCPESGSSRFAHGGLVFHPGTGDYPPPYSGALFVGEFARQCIAMLVDQSPVDGVPETFVSFASTIGYPIDLEIGPDGDLFYIRHLENSPTAGRIRRLRYGGNEGPSAVIGLAAGSTDFGPPPLSVTFDAGPSDDDAGQLTYEWDLDGDGQFDDSTALEPTRVFGEGAHTVGLRVEDNEGLSDTAFREITVSGLVFRDDFESGDTNVWSSVD